MTSDIDRILIDRQQIAARIKAIARQIATDLQSPDQATPTEITLVPILTGSIIFVSDLIRELPLPMQIHVISVSSYPGRSTTSQGVNIDAELNKVPESLEGRHVLVIDDILDSGSTLRAVTDLLKSRNPDCVKTCVLLRKQRPEAMQFPIDYVAFDIPDEFVVGYGLDYDGYYRNLPEIGTLRPQLVQGE